MTDDGRGTLLPGAAEGTVAVQGVWGGSGGGIIGGAQDDTAWASGRGEMELEKVVHGGRAADVLHGLPVQGSPAEMPSGGMPRTSGDEDGNAGTFYAPACPGHRGYFGEGKSPPPMVPPSDMLVPLITLNGSHHATSQCARGEEQKRRQLAEEELREITERACEAYGAPLENVTAFKYLERVMTAGDDEWPAVVGNLQRARNIWGRLLQILSREGADLKVSGHFFKAVTQAVLLFGVEMWVLTPRMERALSSFQHRVTRRLTGRNPRRRLSGCWEYPSLEEAIVESGFKKIRKYIMGRQNTVAQYITT